MRRFLSCLGCLLALYSSSPAAEVADTTVQVRTLFDDYWNWFLRAHPDYASLYSGEDRYNDRLRDESSEAVSARKAAFLEFRDRAARIDASLLSSPDRLSLRVLRFRLDRAVAINQLHGSLPFGVFDVSAPVTPRGGIHLTLADLAAAGPFRSERDYEAWLKRLEAVPRSVANLIDRMQAAIDAGWMPSKVAIARLPQQLQIYLDADPTKSPAYRPFTSFPRDIDPAQQKRLQAAAQQTIRDQVTPAFRTLLSFVETRYLPAARDPASGVSSLPPGLPYYQAWLAWHTTTDLTPQQIHDIGRAEVARIAVQMDGVVVEVGFRGTRAEFQEFITTDAQFFFNKPGDLLAAYREIAKRADPELPKLFAELPRQTYGVRAMRPEEGDNSDHYNPGTADRPGWFEANVNNLKARPKWGMETLLLHEAVPGHHLQTARAKEMTNLPAFRRNLWFPAFGEGWALYAESLGYEMGFYTDPYQKFGNLSAEIFRACRLVVDTGLHAFGWTREQAIEYMVSNTGQTRAKMTAEVDRYLLLPGQATAYKIGEMKIKELRTKAKTALGERFDIRRFHNAVIDSGALPLTVLEQQIDEWTVGQRAAR